MANSSGSIPSTTRGWQVHYEGPEQEAGPAIAGSGCLCEACTATWTAWLMRDTRLGERTAVEAVGSGFSEAAALTSCEETTIGSPGCEDATWCPALRLYLKRGRRKLHWKKEPLLSCCWFCLAVIMVRKAFTTKKQNNWTIYCLKQTAPCTAEKNNTCDSRNPHVASRRTIPWPPLTSIALARF